MSKEESRKISSTKNFITTIIPFFFIAILGFWRVSAFIENLGEEIYAVNQIFYQIFAYLSLAEAGIGAVVVQKYYKLLIDKNKEEINNVYSASKIFLNRISILMLVIGFVFSFGLKLLTNNTLSLGYMQVLLMLFLCRNLVDYFVFSPRFVIQADQKSYKINYLVNFIRIGEIALEIFLLYMKIDYAIILVFTIILRVILNYIINKKILNEYTWLKKVKNPDMSVLSGTKNMLAYRLANIVYSNTDILVISSVLTPLSVTIYASYNYIIKFMADIMSVIVQAVTPGLGNVIHAEDKKESKKILEELNSAFFLFAMFSSVCIAGLIDKFIVLWVGEDKLIGSITLLVMIIILYHTIAKKIIVSVAEIKGWFKESRNIAIAESCINLVLSILLVKPLGIAGVLLATLIATVFTNFWFYPKYVYKKLYNESCIKYHMKYLLYLAITLGMSYISINIIRNIKVENYFDWIILASVFTLVIAIILSIVMYIVSKPFRSFVAKIKLTLKQMLSHN